MCISRMSDFGWFLDRQKSEVGLSDMPADGTPAVIAPAGNLGILPASESRENTASGHKQKQVFSGPNASCEAR
jgi:hypothetical protein